MSFGYQSTQSSLNNQAGQVILNARNALQAILYFNLNLQTIGQANLVTMGFDATDAANMLTEFQNLAAVANMCNGGAYVGPALPYNFLEATAEAWGGN